MIVFVLWNAEYFVYFINVVQHYSLIDMTGYGNLVSYHKVTLEVDMGVIDQFWSLAVDAWFVC